MNPCAGPWKPTSPIMPVKAFTPGVTSSASSAAPSPLLANLVSQWKMNAASGQVEPDTINGHDLANNGTVGSAAGKVNNCRVFPGSGSWLSHATGATFNLYPYTITCWLKVSSGSSYWLWRYNKALNGYAGYFTAGKISFFHYVTGSNKIDGTFATAINDDTWKHIALVVNASGCKLYINGVSDGTLPWTGTPQAPSSGGYFGASVSNLDNVGFAGSMDVMKVWDRALPEEEVLLDYNGGAGIEL